MPEDQLRGMLGATFSEIFSDNKKLARFLIACAGIALIVLVCVWLVVVIVGGQDADIAFSSGNTQILLSGKTSEGTKHLLFVHPRGWQATGVAVKSGDQLRFVAGGSVNIALAGLLESVKARGDLEDKLVKDGTVRLNDRNSPAPEDFFSDADRIQIQPRAPWAGPDGLTASSHVPKFPARDVNRILPAQPLFNPANYYDTF